VNFEDEYIELCTQNYDPDKCRFGGKHGIPRKVDGSLERITYDADDIRHLVELYDAGIRQFDSEISRLFTFVENRELMDETLFVITSDHGEEFMEHGSIKHGHSLYEEIVRVPLTIRYRGARAGRVLDGAEVSAIDIAPTLLGLCGIGAEDLPGVDLSSWMAGGKPPSRPVLFSLSASDGSGPHPARDAQEGVVFDQLKLCMSATDQDAMAFDLQDDPREQSPLSVMASTHGAELMSVLRSQLAIATNDSSDRSMDPESLEKLRALGYVD